MKKFYCTAIVLLLECWSIYSLPTVTPQTATQSGGCDIQSINSCLSTLGGASQNVFTSLLSSPENFKTLCVNYESAKACMSPYFAGGRCSGVEAVGLNTIINGFDYLCSSRGQQIMELFGTCFGNPGAISGLQQCSLEVANHLDINNLCAMPQFYLQCSVNVSQMYCSVNVSRGLIEMTLALFQAYTNHYNCTYNIPIISVPISPVQTTPSTVRTSPFWVTMGNVTELQPVTSRPSACSIGAIGQCLSVLSERNSLLPWQRGQSGNVSDIDLDLACIAYDSIKDCYKTAVNACSPIETIQFDLLVSMYQYVCTPSGKQQFRSLYQCFSNEQAISQMVQCSNFTGIDLSDKCSVPNHFISCSAKVSRDYCNSTAALPAIIKASFKPYQTALNCDLSSDDGVTPQTSLPRLCSTVALSKCLQNVSAFAILPWQTGASGSVIDVDLSTACTALESATDCYKKESSYCEAKFSFDTDLLVSMYTYVCSSEGQKNYQSLRQCFSNQEALSFMSKCGNISGVDLSNYCSVPKHFISCANEASRKFCNSTTALSAIVKASFKPYETTLGCDLSDTDNGNNSNPTLTGCRENCLNGFDYYVNLLEKRSKTMNFSFVEFTNACMNYNVYKDCVSACGRNITRKESNYQFAVRNMFTYVCDNYNEITERTNCYNDMKYRSYIDSKISSYSGCRRPVNIPNNNYMTSQCDALSHIILETILKHYGDVVYFQNGCDIEPQPEVTPTVQPKVEQEVTPEVQPEVQPEVTPEVTPGVTPEVSKLPIKCYDCNSGLHSYRNKNCPTTGLIDDSKTSTVSCQGHCFSRIDRWESGVVYRGCSSSMWLPEFHSNPTNGCRRINGVLWCFCDTDKCNTISMEIGN